jgi:GNAT superfamily N-acetyltransferase
VRRRPAATPLRTGSSRTPASKFRSDGGNDSPLEWSDRIDDIDWRELEHLYRVAPLGSKSADHLRTVFGNSRFRCFVRDGTVLAGAGRALADGADCSYICDVAVLPSHQGQGLGREIVQRLVDASRGHRKIILYSVPGKEGFYRKLGFLRLLTAMAIFRDCDEAIARGHLAED